MKNYKVKIITAVVTLLIFQTFPLFAQSDKSLNEQEQNTVVDSIGNQLKENYVFPEVADKMISKITNNLKKGVYKTIDDPREFATKLTEDLRSVSHDKHLRVIFDPARIAAQNQDISSEDSLASLNSRIETMKRSNFGFQEVKILEGNIGYLDLRSFSDTNYASETAISAMNFLSNADAVIIDLRQNGGGSPSMIQLITSYFYGSEPVHLNNFYWRPTDQRTQTWTLPYVPGNRYPNTPIYILTSGSTFSAAEEFSYNLKNMERATLIGETTGGGAHPGGTVPVTDRFMVWVPSGRAINPITNTNWEGTGVTPHIEVPSNEAIETAHIKALERLKNDNNTKEVNQFYGWTLDALKAKNKEVLIEESVLKSYVGTYGPRVIHFENNTLFYQRGTGTKYELIPMSKNEFMLKGLAYFRIKFLSENNKVVALEGNYQNGRSDKNLKTN